MHKMKAQISHQSLDEHKTTNRSAKATWMDLQVSNDNETQIRSTGESKKQSDREKKKGFD